MIVTSSTAVDSLQLLEIPWILSVKIDRNKGMCAPAVHEVISDLMRAIRTGRFDRRYSKSALSINAELLIAFINFDITCIQLQTS